MKSFTSFFLRELLLTSLSLFVISLFLVPLPKSLFKDYSQVILYENREPMRMFLTSDEKWRIWTPLDEMDPALIRATICYEDRYFFFHPGVNPISVLRALIQNIRSGRIVSGGSTISMQLARILEPKPRTVKSKILEAYRAIHMEVRLGKKRVLEVYMNRAPYGGNIEGVGGASWAYFRKPPKKLRPEEIAYLVSLPQSPTQRHPVTGKQEWAVRARNRVLEKMRRCGIISPSQEKFARLEAIPQRVYPFPFSAPHASDFLHIRYAGKQEVYSTLNPRIQQIVETILQSYQSTITLGGASNASVVVIENSTRKVRALVGSLNYWDEQNDGQVAGFLAFRSPGSALKPFLYALALQNGIITTESLIEDAPTRFGAFQPVNFTETYHGLVPAQKALAFSLNVPFVHILRNTGVHNFLNLLDELGIKYDQSIPYGLSAITGAIDLRLLDLTNAYVTLAHLGKHSSFILLEEEAEKREIEEYSVLNPAAVYLTLQALSIKERPDAPLLSSYTISRVPIYWKTGTSWGFRDAWSIGFHSDYTVGVWVGNFSGKGSPGIQSNRLAAPIMFDILHALSEKAKPIPPPSDKHFSRVKVCAFSGYRPGAFCEETREVIVPKDSAPSRICPFHKSAMVVKKTGYRACPWMMSPEDQLEMKRFLYLPPAVAVILGLPTGFPPLSPECSVSPHSDALHITSPSSGAEYIFPSGLRLSGKIPLQAFTSTKDQMIYWFIQNQYIGSTRSGEILFHFLPSGTHEILAINSSGKKQQVIIRVYHM
ncbi:MAG: penicillin-binding protein 1C [bacterium JZ-2024 1]